MHCGHVILEPCEFICCICRTGVIVVGPVCLVLCLYRPQDLLGMPQPAVGLSLLLSMENWAKQGCKQCLKLILSCVAKVERTELQAHRTALH